MHSTEDFREQILSARSLGGTGRSKMQLLLTARGDCGRAFLETFRANTDNNPREINKITVWPGSHAQYNDTRH